jgi:hypothetical protein
VGLPHVFSKQLSGLSSRPRAKPGYTGPLLGAQLSTYTHSSTAVTSAAEGSAQHSLPAPPLQADSFGPLMVPLAMLLPELRRKKSSAKLKAKAEKTSAAIYFDYPGSWISANKDAMKCMEIKEYYLKCME